MLVSSKPVNHTGSQSDRSSAFLTVLSKGQAYEKKSKKGSKDAGEEHARYINLLSVIGPEMSQEK